MHRQYEPSLQLKKSCDSTVHELGLHGGINYASQSSSAVGLVLSCSVSGQLLSESIENQGGVGSGVTS